MIYSKHLSGFALLALILSGCQTVEITTKGARPNAGGTYEAPLSVRTSSNARLVGKPTAEKKGEQTVISFEVSAAVDTEVAIVNSQGKVIRHLAAGLLGRNAPAPFKTDSLAQKLTWDGRDDFGNMVTGKTCRARIQLGAQPRMEKILGWDGNSMDPINGLLVGANGELYVLFRSWVSRGRVEMRVFDREGQYLRTIMPYSSKTPEERSRSVGHLMIGGQRLPIVFNGHGHSLYPLTTGMKKQTMAWNPNGHVVAVSTLGTAFETGVPRHLLAFAPQGGAPRGMSFVGPELRVPIGLLYGHGEGDDPCFDHVACSPDGKYVYYAGSTHVSRHAVFRMCWGEDKGSGMEEAFVGEDSRPGEDDQHLNDPQGLAVDKKGNLFICDRGNNRIVVASPDGKFIDKFAVDAPEQIAMHPKTGAIYVLSRQRHWGGPQKDTGPMSMSEYKGWKAREKVRKERRIPRKPVRLVKLSPWVKGTKPIELASLDEKIDLMTLDAESMPAKLWTSINNQLAPIVDKGKNFEVGKSVHSPKGLTYPGYVIADPANNRVLVQGLSSKYKVRALDLNTGEKTTFVEGVSELAMAPDGTFIGSGPYNSHMLLRFDKNGKPLAFPGSKDNRVTGVEFTSLGVGLGQRGLCVAPNGDIYFMRAGRGKTAQSRVDVFGPDGKKKKAALIDGLGIGDCGLDVDPAGNVYIGVNVKPRGKLFPKEFEKKIPPHNWLCWAQWVHQYREPPWYYSMRNEYLYHWGSVMKFGPEGGAFYGWGSMNLQGTDKFPNKLASASLAPKEATTYRSGYLYEEIKVAGAKWRYPGMGVVPSSERMWGDGSCVCITSRLATDGFGRVFLPNVFRFCVDMIDTAGNRIAHIGTYGNADDKDGLNFAWPAFVDTADGKLYVSDSVNRRVTVVAFNHSDKATIALK